MQKGKASIRVKKLRTNQVTIGFELPTNGSENNLSSYAKNKFVSKEADAVAVLRTASGSAI